MEGNENKQQQNRHTNTVILAAISVLKATRKNDDDNDDDYDEYVIFCVRVGLPRAIDCDGFWRNPRSHVPTSSILQNFLSVGLTVRCL